MHPFVLAEVALNMIGDWGLASRRLNDLAAGKGIPPDRRSPADIVDPIFLRRVLETELGETLTGRHREAGDFEFFLQVLLGPENAASWREDGWPAIDTVPVPFRSIPKKEISGWVVRFIVDLKRGPRRHQRVVLEAAHPEDVSLPPQAADDELVSGTVDSPTTVDEWRRRLEEVRRQMAAAAIEGPAGPPSREPEIGEAETGRNEATGDPAAAADEPEQPARQKRPRYTDVAIADEHGTELPREEASAVVGEPFELHVRIVGAERRTGIGTKTGTEQATINDPGVAADLLVVATDDEGVFVITERSAMVHLPLDGDSDTATIHIVAKDGSAPAQKRANITLRIYHKLDLVDHLTICIGVRPSLEDEWDPIDDETPSYIDPEKRPKVPRIAGLSARTLKGLDRALNIAVQPGPDGHRLVIVARSKTDPESAVYVVHDTRIGHDEVDHWLASMRTVLLTEVVKIAKRAEGGGSLAVLEETGLEVIGELAEIGRAALVTTGMAPGADNLAKLLADLSPEEGATIQICLLGGATKFVFPWQLLTTASSDTASPSDLWGYRYVLEVCEAEGPRIPAAQTPTENRIACFAWQSFANWQAHKKALEDLVAKDGAGKVSLDITDRFGSRKIWQETLSSAKVRLLYLYGHGESAVDSALSPVVGADGQVTKPAQDSIRFEGTFVTVERMVAAMLEPGREVRFRKDAIVFLNACETAEMLSGVASTFVPVFLACGAAAVLGTEATMPIAATEPFGNAVIQALLKNKPIGEAVRYARKALWDQYRSPLGLAYTLYGDAAARLLDETAALNPSQPEV